MSCCSTPSRSPAKTSPAARAKRPTPISSRASSTTRPRPSASSRCCSSPISGYSSSPTRSGSATACSTNGPMSFPWPSLTAPSSRTSLKNSAIPTSAKTSRPSPNCPYDMAGWTLPLAMGVKTAVVNEPLKALMEPVTEELLAKSPFPEELDEYIILDARHNNSYRAAFELLGKGKTVYRNADCPDFARRLIRGQEKRNAGAAQGHPRRSPPGARLPEKSCRWRSSAACGRSKPGSTRTGGTT